MSARIKADIGKSWKNNWAGLAGEIRGKNDAQGNREIREEVGGGKWGKVKAGPG